MFKELEQILESLRQTVKQEIKQSHTRTIFCHRYEYLSLSAQIRSCKFDFESPFLNNLDLFFPIP